jgi:uncharacterized protein (TIGR02246 family)
MPIGENVKLARTPVNEVNTDSSNTGEQLRRNVMNIAKAVLLGLICVIAFVLAHAGVETGSDDHSQEARTEHVRTVIDSMNTYWIDAWKRHDDVAVLDVYGPDPVAMSSNGAVKRGLAKIQSGTRQFMDEYNPVHVWVTTEVVWLVDNTTAFEYGDYGMTLAPADSDTIEFEQQFVAKWVRQSDDRWKTAMTMTFPIDEDTE